MYTKPRRGLREIPRHNKVENGVFKHKKSKSARMTLVHRSELPTFLKDNEYLLNSHRPQLHSAGECAKSLFVLHTETCNIWTHLLGCVFFVVFSVYFYTRPSVEVDLNQKLWFSTMLCGAILCLGCSAAYHALLCHSEPVYRFMSKLDYVGVITLIVSSFPPWLHYGFYCHPGLQRAYLVAILALGFLCILVVLQDKFANPRFRPLRAGLFSVLGLTGAVPGVHYVIHEGLWHSFGFSGWLILMAALYLAGGAIYAVRIPERFYPGRFDIWAHSHQIMHMCVNGGAISCLYGLHKLAHYRLTHAPECTPDEL